MFCLNSRSLNLYVRFTVLNVHLILTYPCNLYHLSYVNVAYMEASFVVFVDAFAVFLIIGVPR